MLEVSPAVCVGEQKQAEGLPPLHQEAHKMHMGQGVSDPECTMENWWFTQ